MNLAEEQANMRARWQRRRLLPFERQTRPRTTGEPWVPRFFEYLAVEQGVSVHTLSAYQIDLDQFGSVLGKDLLDGTSSDINKFVADSLEAGVSPRTMRRKFAAIRSFYEFVFMEDGVPSNPARYLRSPKASRAIVRAATGKEVEEILAFDSCASDALNLRNQAIVYVFYGSGLRVSELTKLQIPDVDLEHGIVKVRLGKGQKDRFAPMNPREMDAIRLYLESGRPKLSPKPDNDLLFIGRHGKLLTRQRVWQIVTRLSNSAVGRGISPHKFRHGFVTDTINGGAGVRVVQQMAGHADVHTTMGYMHSDLERVRTEYLKSHPRGVAA